jgi:hypothetical protein
MLMINPQHPDPPFRLSSEAASAPLPPISQGISPSLPPHQCQKSPHSLAEAGISQGFVGQYVYEKFAH